VLVNPVVTPLSDETFDNYEGCLSVPNLRGVVPRYATGEGHRAGIVTAQPYEREAWASPRAPCSTSSTTSTRRSSSTA
jgi:hypothetical protein